MIKGVNGQVFLDNNQISITRKGLFGSITRNEDVRIPLERISYIQLVKPGMKNGFINFVMAGSPQINTVEQASKNSCCIIVNPSQYKNFTKFKQEIESKMAIPQPQITYVDNIGTKLEQLSNLKIKGIITESEFEEKKKELLGRM